MSSSIPLNPFVVEVYYGGELSYTEGILTGAPGTRSTSFLVTYHINYNELVDNICRSVQIHRQSSFLELTLYYEYNGGSYTASIHQDSDMYLIYQLATLVQGYTCKIHVAWTPVVPNTQQHGSSSTIQDINEGSHSEEMEDTSESEAPPAEEMEDTSESEPEDDAPIPPLPQHQSQGLTHFPELNDVGTGMDEDYIPLDNFGEDEMDFWNEQDPEIRLNMYFSTRQQVDYAVRLWNISQNREMFVADARPKAFSAKCKSIKEQNTNNF